MEEQLFAELGEQGRAALELGRESFDRAQGRGADVVFHPFDIVMDHVGVQPKEGKKIGEKLVTSDDVPRESFPGGG
jgi:hypothetical protein